MEAHIQGIVASSNLGPRPIHIFGHTSRGLPGLSLLGHSRQCQLLREKLIYLTRARNLNVPLKKYVLCIEEGERLKEYSFLELRYLEFPLLLLYWKLAGVIDIHRLEECFASGQISLEGKIDCPNFDAESLRAMLGERDKIISPHSNHAHQLDPQEILKNVADLSFVTNKILGLVRTSVQADLYS